MTRKSYLYNLLFQCRRVLPSCMCVPTIPKRMVLQWSEATCLSLLTSCFSSSHASAQRLWPAARLRCGRQTPHLPEIWISLSHRSPWPRGLGTYAGVSESLLRCCVRRAAHADKQPQAVISGREACSFSLKGRRECAEVCICQLKG